MYRKIEYLPSGKITNTTTTDTEWLGQYYYFYPSGDFKDPQAIGTVCRAADVDKQISILKQKINEKH